VVRTSASSEIKPVHPLLPSLASIFPSFRGDREEGKVLTEGSTVRSSDGEDYSAISNKNRDSDKKDLSTDSQLTKKMFIISKAERKTWVCEEP